MHIRQVIDILAKYPEVFLDTMMVEELGLMPPDASMRTCMLWRIVNAIVAHPHRCTLLLHEGEIPWKNGLVTFLSFCLFGVVPLLPYVFSTEAGNKEFFITIGLSALTMFFLVHLLICSAIAAVGMAICVLIA